jgi:catechol 2,3-dioxygenase-like lactoylglutathione lyase family enzyme
MPLVPVKRFEFVTIYCRDLKASRKFYVDVLGFPVIREKESDFFQIDVAGVPVCVDLDPVHAHRNNIAVEVADLEQTAAALRTKGFAPPRHTNQTSHEDWLEIEDPDGNAVIFLVHSPVAVP